DFEVRGPLIDNPATVRALLEPTLQELHTSLSAATLPQLAALTARFGYQLVGHVTQEVTNGAKLILSLAPLPMVRNVRVHIPQSVSRETLTRLFKTQLDEEIVRRLGIRVGSYVPWEPVRRECALLEESRRINEYLFDEGYFDARTTITFDTEGHL